MPQYNSTYLYPVVHTFLSTINIPTEKFTHINIKLPHRPILDKASMAYLIMNDVPICG